MKGSTMCFIYILILIAAMALAEEDNKKDTIFLSMAVMAAGGQLCRAIEAK